MTTNVIDTTIHGSSFPTGYTGAGTIAASCKNAGGIINQANGFFTSNNNATQINLGFRPLKITLINITDVIKWEWFYGFGATQALKTVTGGTMTVDTGTAFSVSTDLAGNHTLTISAAANGNAKALVFSVDG